MAKGNKGYGARIAHDVLMDEDPVPRSGSWLDDWTDLGKHRNRARRWLAMSLKSALRHIPPEALRRYLAEMAADAEVEGNSEAVDRLIDKVLPPIRSNGGPSLHSD